MDLRLQEKQGNWECRRVNKLIGWTSSNRANFCPKNTMSVPEATTCSLWKQGGDQLFHQQTQPIQCPACKVLYSCWSSLCCGCIWRGDNTCSPLSEGSRKSKLQGFQFIFLACPHFVFAATADLALVCSHFCSLFTEVVYERTEELLKFSTGEQRRGSSAS